MATFKLNGNASSVFFKFYFVNNTKNTIINYDMSEAVYGRWVNLQPVSQMQGKVNPGGNQEFVNFNSSYNDSSNTLQAGEASILEIEDLSLKFHFFNTTGSGYQLINMLADDTWTVVEDSEQINQVQSDDYIVTLDGGGHNQDSLDIFIQVGDRN